MKKLNEDLMTPTFMGDDLSVNAALQSWTSLMQVFSSVDSMVQDNANRLAILSALSNIIAQKTAVLTQPAQTSMAAAAAGTMATPTADPLTMTPTVSTAPSSATVPAPPPEQPCGCEVEDEEEQEEIVQSDEEGKDPVNPATQADGPEVVKVGDSDDKENDEADKDKKAVVDLTIEDRVARLEKKQQMSESTKRLLELAGLRVKL